MAITIALSPLEAVFRAIEKAGGTYEEAGNDWYKTSCLVSENHKGGDKHPSLNFRENTSEDGQEHFIVFHCFSGGCTRAEILASLGLTFADVGSKGITSWLASSQAQKALTVKDIEQAKLLPASFLMFRMGLREDVLTFHKKEGEIYKKKGVYIPYYSQEGKELEKGKLRKALQKNGPKDRLYLYKESDEPICPYGLQNLEAARARGFLVIEEGESDNWTLSYHSIPAIGIPGAENAEKTLDGTLLAGIPCVYVVQEKSDQAGINFPYKVQLQLHATGYQGQILRVPLKDMTGCKDPSELHIKLFQRSNPHDHELFLAEFQKVLDAAQPMNKDTGTGEEASSLPQIIIGEQLRVTRDEAIKVLAASQKDNPSLFAYQSTFSKVDRDEAGRPIVMQLGMAGLRNELTNAADFYQHSKVKGKDKEDEWTLRDIHPPKELAEQILALAPSKWRLPTLKGIVEVPICGPDGTILDRPGYDPSTQLYYVASPAMRACRVPERPTQEDARQAMAYIQQVFADFIWEGPADRANATGLLFTPFIRHAIKGDVQLAAIDANNAGTGKGLLCIIVAGVAIGDKPMVMRACHDDNEWEKTIIAKLLQSPSIVVIDNVRGVLESSSLELMFTGGKIAGRILGTSKNVTVKNQATWAVTGNNLLIGGDLPRRCYRIRLLSLTANPEEREDITIKDMEGWILAHRVEMIAAILTCIRAWYLAGKPKDSKVPTLATFTEWASTIGGILHFAGIEGWQQNRDELRSKNNEEANEYEAFLAALYAKFGSSWKSSTEIVNAIENREANFGEWNQPPANPLFETLPKDLKRAFTEKQKSFIVVLPIQLQKRVQTVYGLDAYRIEKQKNKHLGTQEWRVMRGVAVGQTTQAQVEKNIDSPSHPSEDTQNKSEVGDGQFNLQQPPATDKANHALTGSEPDTRGNLEKDDLRGVEGDNPQQKIWREAVVKNLALIDECILATGRTSIDWPNVKGESIYGPGKIAVKELARRMQAMQSVGGDSLYLANTILRSIRRGLSAEVKP